MTSQNCHEVKVTIINDEGDYFFLLALKFSKHTEKNDSYPTTGHRCF